ncbi:TetR family transcriptional regulator, partial [Bacillus pseudomycoides]
MSIKNNTNNQKEMSFIEKARRAQIVECAIETIAEVGYAQASLGQIAKRAKI